MHKPGKVGFFTLFPINSLIMLTIRYAWHIGWFEYFYFKIIVRGESTARVRPQTNGCNITRHS